MLFARTALNGLNFYRFVFKKNVELEAEQQKATWKKINAGDFHGCFFSLLIRAFSSGLTKCLHNFAQQFEQKAFSARNINFEVL